MCGRYVCIEDENVHIGRLYRQLRVSYPTVHLKSGEIFPTDTVPLLCYGGNGSLLCPAPGIWGFSGTVHARTGKPSLLINARAETASERPLYRESFWRRRCVIPTLGYYEWSPGRVKHRIRAEGEITYLAGLWRPEGAGVRFVVLTTAASADVAHIHPRMPVILPVSSLRDWVQDANFAVSYLQGEMPPVTARAV